jgi:hypothetical protein
MNSAQRIFVVVPDTAASDCVCTLTRSGTSVTAHAVLYYYLWFADNCTPSQQYRESNNLNSTCSDCETIKQCSIAVH